MISPEREALLKACGFGAPPDGGDTVVFDYRSLALDTRMSVTGDHASDHAYIHYAETDALCGFFYAPSLLEYLFAFHHDAWDVKAMIRELLYTLARGTLKVSFASHEPRRRDMTPVRYVV